MYGVFRSRAARIGFGILVGLPIVALFGWWAISRPATPVALKSSPQPSFTPTPQADKVTSKLLVMGDVFWGRYVHDWSMASPLKYSYPFAGLASFDRPAYDAWIANMECPVTTNPLASSAAQEATLTFNCSPNYLPGAAKWFSAMSLANNHTDNQRAAGWRQTADLLGSAGIQTFGHYDPEDQAIRCNILSLPAQVTFDDGTSKTVKLPTAWCGYNAVFKIPSASAITDIGRYAERFVTFAMPHAGTEYRDAPDQLKTTFYRGLIDAGADAVIGGHPHWVQTSEAYQGKLILYSLGNFLFDQQANREVTRGVALQVTLVLDASAVPDLDKWLALADYCESYTDNCLTQAASQNLTKLPFKISYGILSSDDSGRQVRAGDAALTAAVKDRLGWSNTVAELK